MLETFFVWAFIVLPLIAAVILMFYRARYFLLGVVALVVAIALVWTVVSLIDRAQRYWWPDPSAASAECAPGEACRP